MRIFIAIVFCLCFVGIAKAEDKLPEVMVEHITYQKGMLEPYSNPMAIITYRKSDTDKKIVNLDGVFYTGHDTIQIVTPRKDGTYYTIATFECYGLFSPEQKEAGVK